MQFDQSTITELLAKHIQKKPLSAEESRTLEEWRNISPKNNLLVEVFENAEKIKAQLKKDPKRSDQIWKDIEKEIDIPEKARSSGRRQGLFLKLFKRK